MNRGDLSTEQCNNYKDWIRLKFELKWLKNRCLLMSNYRDLNTRTARSLFQLVIHAIPELGHANSGIIDKQTTVS